MQEDHLYEYAIIRIVPKVEREEFINAGIILYCRKQMFLQTIFTIDEKKLRALQPDIDIDQLEKYLKAFELIANGTSENSPITRLDTASRFRWLTATRSTIIQISKIHPGFCADPQQTLWDLYEKFVR